MGVITVNIACNLLAALIYDVARSFFGSTNKKENKLSMDTIRGVLEEKLGSTYESILLSGKLEAYLNSPLVKDVIENSIIYTITGDNIQGVSYFKKDNDSISEEDIVKYLSTNYLDSFDEKSICRPSEELILSFFRNLLKCSREIILSLLSSDDKSSVYLVTRRITMAERKIDELVEMLKKMIKSDVFLSQNSFADIVRKYHRILKTNHSRAHVYLLDTIDFEEFYVPPSLHYIPHFSHSSASAEIILFSSHSDYRGAIEYDEWQSIFDDNNIVYVIGGAGYGKSLFLKKIINDYNQMSFLNCADYLVIYGDLKLFFTDGEEPLPVLKYLQKCMMKETLMSENQISTDLIEYYIKAGRCLILLDALDEVEKQKREELHKKVVAFFKNENPNNKICITSRDRGFIPEKDISAYYIQSLDRTQIETYVDKIIKIKKFDKNDKKVFMEQSESLMKKGFLSSFLILSLLINIYKAERELPENKMELYQKCFEYIAFKREKEKTKEKYDWALISCMMKDNTFMELARMCYPNNTEIEKKEIEKMLCSTYSVKYRSEAESLIAAEGFLEFCSDRTELFVPASGEGKFKFFHRSFFEYFYSLYIFHRRRTVSEIYDSLMQFDVDSEVFELTLAMLKQKDEGLYQGVIDYLLSSAFNEMNKRGKHFSVFNVLTLSMQVVDDLVFIDKYCNLFLCFRDKIALGIKTIPNQKIIYDLIKKNNQFAEEIYGKYKEYGRLSVIMSYLNNYKRALSIINYYENHEIDKTSKRVKRRILFSGFDTNFFTKMFRERNNCNLIVNELSGKELNYLMDTCKLTAKQKDKYIKLFSQFEKLSEKERKKINSAIFD